MCIQKIRDIGILNISSYVENFEMAPENVQDNIKSIQPSIHISFNTSIDVTLEVISGQVVKNRFDICAAKNNMTISEFLKLPKEQQVDLLSHGKTSEARQFMQRRVDFSHRFTDGPQLTYFSLNINSASGNMKYGNCCIILKPHVHKQATALKYDSLRHYYSGGNAFDKANCFQDLLPYEHVGLLIWDKLKNDVSINKLEAIIQSVNAEVENDEEPLEVMTSEITDVSCIAEVIFPLADYELAVELSTRKAIGEILAPEEDILLSKFIHFQRELDRNKIPLTLK